VELGESLFGRFRIEDHGMHLRNLRERQTLVQPLPYRMGSGISGILGDQIDFAVVSLRRWRVTLCLSVRSRGRRGQ
jgi:hypothetical protein